MRARIKGLWKVLFGRTTIFVFLILIQLIVIIMGIGFLGTKVLVANNVVGVLSIIVLIYLINVRQNTSFKLMWIILIVATPIIGVPFFIYNRLQPGTRQIPNKLGGVLALVLSILILVLVPFLHTSKQRSIIFRPISQCIF